MTEPATCCCGSPATTGTVHRTDGPCYRSEPAQPLDRPCSQWSLQVSHDTHTFFHSDGHATCPGWGQPTQPLDLAPIQARHGAATSGTWYLQPNYGPDFVACELAGYEHGIGTLNFGDGDQADADRNFVLNAHTDTGKLLAEVLRLRAENEGLRTRVTDLETFANGCDGEGCVLPHSSWCARAKAQADENDGCTCPMPWPGTPQPHAGYCWLVSPPRDEQEQLRVRLLESNARTSELEAELAAEQVITAGLRAKVAELKKTPTERANDHVRQLREAGDYEAACAAAEAYETAAAYDLTHPRI